MKEILWDGKLNTLKELFPSKGTHAIMYDNETGTLVIIPDEEDNFKVDVGTYIIKNDDGSVTKMIEL